MDDVRATGMDSIHQLWLFHDAQVAEGAGLAVLNTLKTNF